MDDNKTGYWQLSHIIDLGWKLAFNFDYLGNAYKNTCHLFQLVHPYSVFCHK